MTTQEEDGRYVNDTNFDAHQVVKYGLYSIHVRCGMPQLVLCLTSRLSFLVRHDIFCEGYFCNLV